MDVDSRPHQGNGLQVRPDQTLIRINPAQDIFELILTGLNILACSGSLRINFSQD